MSREIGPHEVDALEGIIGIYLDHKQEHVTSETVMNQIKNGISKGSHRAICYYDYENNVRGFLIHNRRTDRFPIIFGNWIFDVERNLFDCIFTKLESVVEYMSFESGYPTPWISNEFSEYAISKGFDKHDRAYMQHHPINLDYFPDEDSSEEHEFTPFSYEVLREVSELVFRSVDNTVDQQLWPFVYGTLETTTRFQKQLLDGELGTHKPWYSWILRKDNNPIGACFMTTQNETANLMHIVIDPVHRKKGLGRYLLTHTIRSLLSSESHIKKLELAVTLGNPAKLLYDSLRFKVLNESSTYIWNR